VRFVETLAEEVRDFGIDVNAIAPGALNTKMLDEILEAFKLRHISQILIVDGDEKLIGYINGYDLIQSE
jgi:NAD(P)-dependent dehydrogenase (short-subunit alcohol dehydrogenase family)